MFILNSFKYKVSDIVFTIDEFYMDILDILKSIVYIEDIETRKRRFHMTSLLGHEFRKQALFRVARILGTSTLKTALYPARARALAALHRYHSLALTN
jgi:hypothetical protein